MEKTRIVLIENDEIIAQDIKDILEKNNYEVLAVLKSGTDAISAIRALKPDVAIFDVHLQNQMDGVDAVKILNSFISLPVLFITGYTDEKTLDKIHQVTVSSYLLKPFKEQELTAKIQEILKNH